MLPVMLNVKDKDVVIFGGGEVAERRVSKLLNADANVKVVSREFTDTLMKIRSDRLRLVEVEVEEGSISDHLKGADFVLIATDDSDLNDKIEEGCRNLGILVNRADKVSDFVIPATLDLEGISISISTEGKSPAISKMIKRRIKKLITKEDILLIELEEFLKARLKQKIKDQKRRKEILREITNRPEIVKSLKENDIGKAKELVEDYLEE
ncbi:MAG: bifunctional precorrin-2 dehydrogenase/sirohydrochlorin ferrochelatase [Candidatus Hydrothermarchaeales archaeon]